MSLKQLLDRCGAISKVDVLGALGRASVPGNSRPEKLKGLDIAEKAAIAALEAQNAVIPAGVAGANRGREDPCACFGLLPIRAGHPQRELRHERPNDPFGRHHANVTRGPADPAQPIFRVQQDEMASASRSPCRTGGDVLTPSGCNEVEHAMAGIPRQPARWDRADAPRRPTGYRRARGGRLPWRRRFGRRSPLSLGSAC